MVIALDAMGGDFAPYEIIKGAVECAKEFKIKTILVGKSEQIKEELKKYDYPQDLIEIHHASQVIEMKEHPAFAVREKEDSSIVVSIKLLRDKKVDAVVSAGNTGAVMSSALLYLGRISGIKRPAIATIIPTLSGKPSLLLDIGANVDCKKEYLEQFAIMGKVYMEEVFNILSPRIGLLNIGEEEGKGNILSQETYALLKSNPLLNFVGNVEGKDLFNSLADVIVCDGFVGNVCIKTAEGVADALFTLLSSELKSSLWSKILAGMLIPKFRNVKKKLDYSEYGGAPLLGVNGIVIISHGRSKAKAIKNAIKLAQQVKNQNLVEKIKSGISLIRREENEREI
ncbi:MAG: phosphate acyltransferase PlsX [Dictyoglomus sp.]|nr:phosphate acyltransferase PlsX [Dictyoglomus sp.]MCX7942554.1 phosphate acyltransferase PlsX [Dictyoglomaceae bacterium]MDW8188792.1 phosphate acyltransferase PlsX [Dictyoglomus sp.]